MSSPLIKELAKEGLVPACGGTETPFTFNGVEWIFCWHEPSNQRLYYNITESRAVWNTQFHPVTDPQYEFVGYLNFSFMEIEADDAYF